MGSKIYYFILGFLLICGLVPFFAQALGPEDCKSGYVWDRMSGVGCVQKNCNDIPDAHYSYTGRCICGSSGSIAENPADPNKACTKPADDPGCPGCVYACVHTDEPCPGEKPPPQEPEQIIPDQEEEDYGDEEDWTDEDWEDWEEEWDEEDWFEDEELEEEEEEAEEGEEEKKEEAKEGGQPKVDQSRSPSLPPLSNQGTTQGQSCHDYCRRFCHKAIKCEVILAEGTPPNCKCQVEHRDKLNRLVKTVEAEGEYRTTWEFDPQTGGLKKKEKVNVKEELEKIRKRLGYKYSQEQIDKLLQDGKVNKWFNKLMEKIETKTSILHPQFWWQHFVAILDHGFNKSDPDFVDTHNYGRCGDSMKWLERNLKNELKIGADPDNPGKIHEAMVSITGESYWNLLNHTGLLIRPEGISNQDWEDMVKSLQDRSGGTKKNPGMFPREIQAVDPRLLDAKVLDPYKKEITTVRKFIKGWSYIRVS